MADKSLFEKIVDDEIPAFKVWEDDNYLAFLTPWPSVEGMTVVVPKKNLSDYVFSMSDDEIAGLMGATRKVANILEKAFNVSKVALVFEGEGVPHVHAKLFPMHGLEKDRSNFPATTGFFPQYPGYISTVAGPKMTDEQLLEVQLKIKKAAE